MNDMQKVLEFMAADSAGREFTTQQLAHFALGDPYRAGELRDVILPALERAGKVRILEADDDHNSRRYVLADSPADSVAATSVYSLGCRVCITADRVTINAGPSALYEWARSWPCSELARTEGGAVIAEFDSGGLVDLDCPDECTDVSSDELSAFTSDVLREVLNVGHPAYFVTVGQFESEGR